MLHLFAGGLAFLRWAVPLFALAIFIDWLTYMPAPVRALVLITLLAISFYRAWRCGWCDIRPFNAVRTALQLETHHGDLKSLLVSAIQLRDQKAGAGVSQALCDRTCTLAEAAASGLRPEQAVPYQPLHRPGAILLMLAVLVGVFAAVNAPFLSAGAIRFFAPWVVIEYPTNTQITLDPNELVLKEGDIALIEARIDGVVPTGGKIYLRTGEGRARVIDLEITNSSCVYTIDSASRDFSYRFKVGDDRTGWQNVRVVQSPRIERVQVELEFPAYLDRAPESVEALTMTVPEGTRVNWRITLDRPVSEVQLSLDDQQPVDLDITEDGRGISFSEAVVASRGYNFSWVEKEHGFRFTSPRYYLQVASDQAPRVELTSPSSNVVAMLGRPLELAVRAQDDHGIGSSAVAYRVNQHDEKWVDLQSPVQNGRGDQPIDWDYRTALPDLEIGDTVSFAMRISDRYPGDLGPHVVQSETRRITFLSKADYLKQIEKKKDRLLSRVQTIYRQQRSAHDVVRTLTPDSDGYIQACQLEAIRQELVRDQIEEIAKQMQALLDDLAANNVSGEAAAESLEKVRTVLLKIAESHIGRAASLLRDQSEVMSKDPRSANPARAASAVNTAARELGSLVLLRGIDSAQEVYAREARMLAQAQASLRWRTVADLPAGDAEQRAKDQDQLAIWTERLISDIQNGMRYDKRPLAVLRLIRSVKDLKRAGTDSKMRQARALIAAGKPDEAASLQADLVRTLLNAEFSVRLSGAYSTLLATRNQIGLLVEAQSQQRKRISGMSAIAFESNAANITRSQTQLRKQLLTMLLPTVPAPRAQLFDETAPQVPAVQDLLIRADRAMADALSQISSGQQKEAVAQQLAVEKELAELARIVDRWSIQMGLQTQGLSTLVAATSNRLARLEEYEARVIGLLEKTDIAASEEQKVETLADTQLILTDEVTGFKRELVKQDQMEPDQDLPPLLSRLTRVERAMSLAVQSLEKNDADQAIGYQEQSADILAEAYELVLAQNERLSLLQDLLMFQRAVGFANRYMTDIVAEQRVLLASSETMEPEAMTALLPQFVNIRQCIEDVAPLLDLVAGRLDAGTPLAFAKADLEDAMASLQSGDKFDAIDAQDVAAESLAQVQALVQAVQTETGYVAEIVEFLHLSVADAAMMQYQQQELRSKVAVVKQDQLQGLVNQQQALLDRADTYGRKLESAAGMRQFAEAAKLTRKALSKLEAKDTTAAADEMELASSAFAEDAEALFAVITMLHGLPSIEITNQTEPELIRLIDVLALASRHKDVFRQTSLATAQERKQLATTQSELASRCKAIAQAGAPHPMLQAASEHLSQAATTFNSSDTAPLNRSQKRADEKLRHFIIEQALILETAVPPASAEDGSPTDDGDGSDAESEFAAGFISDFVSGEAPPDKRTEWKVLADRNRAALNQNFARELPLEYRGLLKNYYERVAK